MRHHVLALLLANFLFCGCTIRPEGEMEERQAAVEAGRAFETRFEERELPPVPSDAGWQVVLDRALHANAELEQRYWEWLSALERVPQESTSATTAMFNFESMITGGMGSFLDRTSVSVSNDPMANIPTPGKLALAGRIALAEARATGLRFEKARLELKSKIVKAWWEWAVLGERIRLKEGDLGFLQSTVEVVDARVRVGVVSQGELLKAQVQRDLAQNDLETLRSRVPGRRSELNTFMSRGPLEQLELPAAIPEPRPLTRDIDDLLALAAARNPELLALARQLEGRADAIELARQQYIPEFSLGAGLGLGDLASTVFGAITMPFLRAAAIEGRIEQARADLRATEAMRRQVGNDLLSRLVLELYAVRNTERQVALFRDFILPQTEQSISSLRSAYSVGRVPLAELLDGLRTLIEVRTTLAELRGEREKSLAEIEAVAGIDIDAG